MRSRFIALVGLVLVLALVGAACSSDDTGEESTTTTEATTTTTEAPTTTTTAAPTTTVPAEDLPPLVIWADEKRAPVIEEIAPAFTEATGVEIQVTLVDFGDMKDEVTTKGPAGEGPDIFIGAHDWVGELADNGAVAPIDLGGRADEFTLGGLAALRWDGQQYGLPYVTEAVALYYNTDLVPIAPTTLAELTATCDAVEVENCLGIPGGNDGGDAYHHYPFLSAAGGYIFGYDVGTGFDVEDIGLDSTEAVAGIAVLEGLITNGYVASTNYDDAKNLFLAGDQAYWLTGPWELGTLQDQSDVNWSVTMLPTVDGNPMRPFVGVQGFYMSAFSENQAVAEEFLLNYIATPETMLALFEADPRGSAYLATLDEIKSDPVNATFALSAATGQFMPNVPEMGAVWGPVGDNFLALRNGDIGAAEAATNMADQVATVIAEG
ncbi:MAG: maltose ABC transporter substrate-binding protein [Actinomycetia bacterium]|nr:maltose ABC transporter substrate-binding protein [Actinomycetes bacterium]